MKLMKIVLFVLLLVFGYFLTPKHIFLGNYKYLAYIFIVLFAILNYCILKTIYRNYVYNKKQKGFTKGVIASILGVSALQVCGLSAYACSTSIGFTILATFLPHTFLNFLQNYSVEIISISILIQFITIWHLKCFNFWDIKLDWNVRSRKNQKSQ